MVPSVQGTNTILAPSCNAVKEYEKYDEVAASIVEGDPEKERQISVDPVSLNKSSSESLVRDSKSFKQTLALPPLAAKLKCASVSLPNSPATSPRFGSSFFKKLWRSDSQDFSANSPLGYMKQGHFARSKSSGEGRTSSIFGDIELKGIASAVENKHSETSPKLGTAKDVSRNGKKSKPYKCGSCLYLPSFGKAKPVRARRFQDDTVEHVISTRVSMEKFECGSWASCPFPNDSIEDEEDDASEFFELPQELIRGSGNDAESPVSTAFVFDKDPKGILKHDLGRNSCESTSRHVRFSTSCPTSPRLQQARDDFSSFLEAQAT